MPTRSRTAKPARRRTTRTARSRTARLTRRRTTRTTRNRTARRPPGVTGDSRRRQTRRVAVFLVALVGLSTLTAGVALGGEVPRGGDRPTFDPGVGGPNSVVVSERAPVVFRGEDDIEFVDASGESVDAAKLIGATGDAEGIPLESPIARDQTLGRYAIDGNESNVGVTVQQPRVTDLELLNSQGVDVSGARVQESEPLLVRAEWNFQRAEDLSLVVTNPSGLDVTGDVLVDAESLADGQRDLLTGPYARTPDRVRPEGQRGTETGIEYLQGLGQFERSELGDDATMDAAFWALDFEDARYGEYTIAVEGWNHLDFGSATRSASLVLRAETDALLELEADNATRGQGVEFTVRGSPAGETHYVVVEDSDFRTDVADERVFPEVNDIVDQGTSDSDGDGTADFAWARVEIDEGTGSGVGQLDTEYLDDATLDLVLYGADRNLSAIPADLGDPKDERTLDVREGTLSIASPDGTYVAGEETDLRGTASPGIDDVAVYVRDEGDWELLDSNVDGQLDGEDFLGVDADGEWEAEDVRLSDANTILGIPGRYRLGVVAVNPARDGTPRTTLTTSAFGSATNEQVSIRVTRPTLGDGNVSSLDSTTALPLDSMAESPRSFPDARIHAASASGVTGSAASRAVSNSSTAQS